MKNETKSVIDVFLVFLFLFLFFSAVGVSFYKYFYKNDYDYLVEASCDPSTENCFFRDCENEPDSCPPNNLSFYKEFYVKGYDFKKCSNNSCDNECKSGTMTCREIVCGEESDTDICSESL